jgi:hypothetical protein
MVGRPNGGLVRGCKYDGIGLCRSLKEGYDSRVPEHEMSLGKRLLSATGILLLTPAVTFASGSTAFIPLLAIPTLMLVPALLFGNPGSSGPSDSDGGGGGGPPPEPPTPPAAPRGGIPLPDAEPSPRRVRDHASPGPTRVPRRRPAHEPTRSPVPARRGGHV